MEEWEEEKLGWKEKKMGLEIGKKSGENWIWRERLRIRWGEWIGKRKKDWRRNGGKISGRKKIGIKDWRKSIKYKIRKRKDLDYRRKKDEDKFRKGRKKESYR